MNRSIFVVVLVLLVCLFSPELKAAEPSSTQVQSCINDLQKRRGALKKAHDSITASKAEMIKVRHQAFQARDRSMASIFGKGALDLITAATVMVKGPFNAIAEALVQSADPGTWTDKQKMEKVSNLSRDAANRNRKLTDMYGVIDQVGKAPLSRFEDDQPPLPYCKSWWGKPDGKKDDQTELVFRKIYIIEQLSNKVVTLSESELSLLRNDIKQLDNEIETQQKELEKAKQREKLEEETEKWHKETKEHHERLNKPEPRQEPRFNPLDMGPEHEDEIYSQPATPARPAQDVNATIYIDSSDSRQVTAGKPASFTARVDPASVRGTIKWTLDDRLIATSGSSTSSHRMTKTFSTPGVYDMQVCLYVPGESSYHDCYMDQVRVKPEEYPKEQQEQQDFSSSAPAAARPAPADTSASQAYPSSLEGQKTVAVDLPCCKYWAVHQNGKVYLTGHYFTLQGQKVEYTSESIRDYNPAFPNAGMSITASGTGYHIYHNNVDCSRGPQQPCRELVIARMRGTQAGVLHRLNITIFLDIDIPPDSSRIIVNYCDEFVPIGQDCPKKVLILD